MMLERLPSLPPKIHPVINRFLNDEELVCDILDALGSPLSILFPENLEENVGSFAKKFKQYGIVHRICYAHKANQSTALARMAESSGVAVDVASEQELAHALSCGFPGNRIEATGPKNDAFLRLAIQHGVVVNVDSLDEMDRIRRVRESVFSKAPVRALLRFSGFGNGGKTHAKDSRFGIPISQAGEAASMLAGKGDVYDYLGIAFHLDTTRVSEKAAAIMESFSIMKVFESHGLETRILDIGGGYKVNYIRSREDWDVFETFLRDAVIRGESDYTWHDQSFGLTAEQGTIRGTLNTYRYYDSSVGAEYLGEILEAPFSGTSQSIGEVLADSLIEVWIEPGRALVDQCGITLAEVVSVRPSARGIPLIGLDMKRSDIAFLDQEVFVDPVTVFRDKQKNPGMFGSGFLAGTLCLESDLIMRRQVRFERMPSVGDILAFVNTAGYMMDFSATHSIRHPVAEKIAVRYDPAREKFVWYADDRYRLRDVSLR